MACPSTATSRASSPLSREAAHSERRIVHVRGDMAGAAIMQALVDTVRKTPSIRLLEGYIGETLLTDGKRVTGIVARPTERRLAGDVPGRAPSCSPPAASATSTPSPPTRRNRKAPASAWRRAPAR